MPGSAPKAASGVGYDDDNDLYPFPRQSRTVGAESGRFLSRHPTMPRPTPFPSLDGMPNHLGDILQRQRIPVAEVDAALAGLDV